MAEPQSPKPEASESEQEAVQRRDVAMATFFVGVRAFRVAGLRVWRWIKNGFAGRGVLWKDILSFPVVIAGAAISIGVGVMSFTPPDFSVARGCFIFAAILLFIRAAFWLSDPKAGRMERMVYSFVIFGVLGVGLVESLNWVRNRQAITQSASDSNKGAAASPTSVAVPSTSSDFREKPADAYVVFRVGGNEFKIGVVLLCNEPIPLPIGGVIGSPLFNYIGISLKDGKPFVDVKMRGDGKGAYEVQIKHNEFEVNKSGAIDRNFNARAFEVVDGNRRPILQIYYKGADEVVINGIFESPSRVLYVTEERIMLNPSLANAPSLKPMFKYPSVKFFGVFDPNCEPK
jgi:hypothetical protein